MFRATLLVMCLGSLLAGCAFRSMALKNLDTVATTWVKHQLTLDSRQLALLEEGMTQFWQQVRCQRLPGLKQDLERFRANYEQQKKLTPELAAEAEKTWQTWRQALLGDLVPVAAPWLVSLDQAQWQEIAETLQERRESGRKLTTTSDAEQRAQLYADELAEQFSRWYGSTTSEQKDQLAIKIPVNLELLETRYKLMIDSHERFVGQLQGIKDAPQAASLLHRWIKDPPELYSPALRNSFRQRRGQWLTHLLLFDELATPAQRQYFTDQWADIANDLMAAYDAGTGCPRN